MPRTPPPATRGAHTIAARPTSALLRRNGSPRRSSARTSAEWKTRPVRYTQSAGPSPAKVTRWPTGVAGPAPVPVDASSRRPADRLEHLAGRGLLLQRLPEAGVAVVQLREQAGVLDRDDGLVGERL